MIRRLIIWLLALTPFCTEAQPRADFRPCLFYLPGGSCFLETNLTLDGRSISCRKIDSRYQNSALVTVKITKDTSLVKTERYNLHGPFFTDSTKAPTFIDVQRYILSPGIYSIEVTITDIAEDSHPLQILSQVTADLEGKPFSCSTLQPLEKFSKAVVKGPLTKSGYNLLPYNTDFFPTERNKLGFYWEVYNSDSVLGSGTPVVLEWYIENADSVKLNSFGHFRKQVASKVNVLLAEADISTLGTGKYALVTQLKDRKNNIRAREKYFFTRENFKTDIVVLQNMTEKERIHAFVGNCNNADTLQMFVECLWPIASNEDKEKIVNESVNRNVESMKKFIVNFWQQRAADSGNAVQMWGRYYKEVQKVMVLFKCGKQKGYYSDQGRVYLQYGPPNARTEQPNEPNTYPYEIWQYYRITDRSTGNFYTNRKFVFVNRSLADQCYNLVHSDMPGELSNSRWPYEVTRHNTEGKSNPDRNAPGNIRDNQFLEIYQNPR